MIRPIAGAATLLSLATAAAAQAPGRLQIAATLPIPPGKIAVELSSQSELGRELRGQVMERLARRGNAVGASGGHVLMLTVFYPRPLARDALANAPTLAAANDVLRMTLSVHRPGSAEPLWSARAACVVAPAAAFAAAGRMLDALFTDPDRSRQGDANCP
jgi:hypothetical protein